MHLTGKNQINAVAVGDARSKRNERVHGGIKVAEVLDGRRVERPSHIKDHNGGSSPNYVVAVLKLETRDHS